MKRTLAIALASATAAILTAMPAQAASTCIPWPKDGRFHAAFCRVSKPIVTPPAPKVRPMPKIVSKRPYNGVRGRIR